MNSCPLLAREEMKEEKKKDEDLRWEEEEGAALPASPPSLSYECILFPFSFFSFFFSSTT